MSIFDKLIVRYYKIILKYDIIIKGDYMLYPRGIKNTYKKEVTYDNRGMMLENLIEQANNYYRENDLAYIYKKPTPIKVVKTKFSSNSKKIVEAFYEKPSTLDFNGIYKGKYIEFDAKETSNKTAFPISNVHDHQIKHIRNIYKHGGIVFLIISMNNKYFILMGKDFLEFLDNYDRKSIPYKYIEEKGIEIKMKLKGLDYLSKLGDIL